LHRLPRGDAAADGPSGRAQEEEEEGEGEGEGEWEEEGEGEGVTAVGRRGGAAAEPGAAWQRGAGLEPPPTL